MKTNIFKKLIFTLSLCFVTAFGFSQTMGEPLSGVEDSEEHSTLEVIYMDKDLSIFANLLALSGLDASLESLDQGHTLFIPKNEAFNDMTIEKFAELTHPENRAMLIEFVNRHFTGSKIHSSELSDANILDLEDSRKIKIYKEPNMVAIGGATVVAADIETSNGIIHVVDDVVNVTE